MSLFVSGIVEVSMNEIAQRFVFRVGDWAVE